jgi:hypothetical protein
MRRPSSIVSICSRFCLALALGGTALAWSSAAEAQAVDELGSYRPFRRSESPRDFSLELRLGPYLPRVDSEFSDGSHPFRDYFGTKNRIMVGSEFDCRFRFLIRCESVRA